MKKMLLGEKYRDEFQLFNKEEWIKKGETRNFKTEPITGTIDYNAISNKDVVIFRPKTRIFPDNILKKLKLKMKDIDYQIYCQTRKIRTRFEQLLHEIILTDIHEFYHYQRISDWDHWKRLKTIKDNEPDKKKRDDICEREVQILEAITDWSLSPSPTKPNNFMAFINELRQIVQITTIT